MNAHHSRFLVLAAILALSGSIIAPAPLVAQPHGRAFNRPAHPHRSIPLIDRWALLVGTHNDFYPSLLNGGFEEPGGLFGPADWMWFTSGGSPFASPNHDSTHSHSGQYSAQTTVLFDPPDCMYDQSSFWHQGSGSGHPLAVHGGAGYTLSAWTMTENVCDYPWQGVSLQIVWYDANGRMLGEDSTPFFRPPAWQQVTLSATAPATAATADLNLWFVAGCLGPPASGWFDDVRFTLDSPPGTDNDAYPADVLDAYAILKDHGYRDDHIIMMVYHQGDADIRRRPGGPDLLDGPDGVAGNSDDPRIDYENGAVTKANLERAITDPRFGLAGLADRSDEIVVYINSHGLIPDTGDPDTAAFSFEATGETVGESELAGWLSQVQSSRMTLLLDFCYAASFLDSFNDSKTTVVAASDRIAYYFAETFDSKIIPSAPSATDALGADFAASGHAYVVGEAGSMIEYIDCDVGGGCQSNVIVTPTGENLNDIAFRPLSRDYALIVGDGGVILRYTPASGFESIAATGEDLHGVAWMPDERFAVIVGSGSTVLRFDDSSGQVTAVDAGTSGDDFLGVACREVTRDTEGAADFYYEALVTGTGGRINTYRGWYNPDTSAEDLYFLRTRLEGNVARRGLSWSYDWDLQPPWSGNDPPDPDWIWGAALLVGDTGSVLLHDGSPDGYLSVAGASSDETLRGVAWQPTGAPGGSFAIIVGDAGVGDGTAYATDGLSLQPLDLPHDNVLHAVAWEPAARYAYGVGEDFFDAGDGWFEPTVLEFLPHVAGSWYFAPFWEAIDAGQYLTASHAAAATSVPIEFGPFADLTVQVIQNPQLQDGVGDADSYSFVK